MLSVNPSLEALKLAASVSLTIALSLAFGWQKPYWAAVVVIILAITPGFDQGIAKGRMRLIGTVFGGFIGLVWVALFSQSELAFLFTILIAGALCAYGYTTKSYGYALKIAFIVASIVFFAGGFDSVHSFSMAVLRIQQTLLGLLVFYWVYRVVDFPRDNNPRSDTPISVTRSDESQQLHLLGIGRAKKFVLITCAVWLAWFWLPMPGGVLFPLLAATLGLTLVEFNSASYRLVFVTLTFWSLFVLFQLVSLLPQLTELWQLAGFFFVNLFVIWRVFSKPEHTMIRLLGAQMLVLLTMGAQNLRPSYDILMPITMLLLVLLLLIIARWVSQLFEWLELKPNH
ncbi:FUSC family protein [Paraferrimonas sedimenticola]|uniref:Fusaric acid resistance protein-like n=1 Tax=Paraferrimonas sedimenticola TaxID=375674 RepID=A0AA37W0A4_9GAMM|nr:FUSC family protein [Paraferrimonas sedimenticola]GLP96145.1 hypothetical protein GCM10007895_14510 [Paraferrimonas sedimenticola]